MIDFEQIKTWFPENFQQKQYARFILREYLQFQILDFLSNSKYAPHLSFIGGTNLRLIHGIDRFSEDLNFDHKDFSRSDFMALTDSIIIFLKKSGYSVSADNKEKDKDLKAFRRSIVFPEFLFQHNLSPFKDEKFLIKFESQNQGIKYTPEKTLVRGCGFIFHLNTPPLPVLCSMKISALINRSKGRDFFDTIFCLEKQILITAFYQKQSASITSKNSSRHYYPLMKKLISVINQRILNIFCSIVHIPIASCFLKILLNPGRNTTSVCQWINK